MLSRLREFDAYTKPLEDFRVKTLTGGAVTLVASLVMLVLAVSETAQFMQTEVVEQLFVDSTSSDIRVDVNFDVTFHKLPCAFVTVDVMDISSDNQDNIQDDIYKVRIDEHGRNLSNADPVKQEVNTNKTSLGEATTVKTECGSCYGAADGCCNTCEEVKEAYHMKGWQLNPETVEQCKNDKWVLEWAEHKGEGCRVYGKVQVAKVAGNFHIAPGDPFRAMRSHVHDLHSMEPSRFDASHMINHLSFGHHFPGKKYPMDGQNFDSGKGGVMYQYYVKVVPTAYAWADGRPDDDSHQFSVTTHPKDLTQGGVSGLPGWFIQYEFSPLMVKYQERRQPLSTFLVNLCAIIGGVFTVASLLDSAIYHSHRAIQKKMEINKLG